MKNYVFKAVNLQGEIIKGVSSCEDTSKFYGEIRKKGYYIYNFKSKILDYNIIKHKKLNDNQISIICFHIHSFLKCGMDFCSALEFSIDNINNKSIKKVLLDIKSSIENGKTITNAFREFESYFPVLFLNMILVGESSGKLCDVIDKCAFFYQKRSNISRKIISSLSYPLTVLIFSIIVLIFMISKIIPIFTSILEQNGGSIPVITQIVLASTNFMINNLKYFLIIILTLFLVSKLIKKSNFVNKASYYIRYNFIITKHISRKLLEIRIGRNLSMLLSGGIDILKALGIILDGEKNIIVKNKLHTAFNKIREGNSIYESFKCTNMFSSFFMSMLRSGEKSGEIVEMLTRACNISETILERRISQFIKLLQPILIIILSIFIGIIIISFIIPFYNFMDKI